MLVRVYVVLDVYTHVKGYVQIIHGGVIVLVFTSYLRREVRAPKKTRYVIPSTTSFYESEFSFAPVATANRPVRFVCNPLAP